MQKLPQIHYWRDRIDQSVVAFHAVRGWGDRPSNGVFMLELVLVGTTMTWTRYTQIMTELAGRLKERERALLSWYGPWDWRNHLCARVRADGEIVDDFERA